MSEIKSPRSLLEVILIAGAISVLTAVAQRTFVPALAPETDPTGRIVVADTDRIITQRLEALRTRLTSGGPESDIRGEGERLATRMTSILDEWTRAGYVVLPPRSVVAYPHALDITTDIEQKLGQ